MAVFSSIIAGIGLAIGVGGAIAANRQAKDARRAQQEAQRANERARAEGAAGNARDAAISQRQRIREERVKRAQIMAASENSGTSASSLEMGAIGGMQTQFGAASGASAGMFAQGQRISMYAQQAADWTGRANNNLARSQMYGQVANMGWGMFTSVGQAKQRNEKLYGLIPIQ